MWTRIFVLLQDNLFVESMALDFLAGCLGGCAGVLVGYPFDTVKVKMQMQDSKCPKYTGMINCFTTIIHKEQVSGLYKGMTSPLAGVAFINALIFGVYGNVQRRLPDPHSLQTVALAGAIAGVAQSVICCPMELVKLRLQIQDDVIKQSSLSPRTKTIVKKYLNPWDCVTKIQAAEGAAGFYRGFGITAVREAPAFGIYFGSYEWLMSLLQTPGETSGAFPVLLAGGLSGIFSWVFTYPIDVVKTRLQADGESGQRMYTNALDCCVKSYRNEGIQVFTRGLLSTIVRAFPTNAATFVVVSWTFRLLSNGTNNVQEQRRIDDCKRILHEGKKFEDIKPMSDFNTFIA